MSTNMEKSISAPVIALDIGNVRVALELLTIRIAEGTLA